MLSVFFGYLFIFMARVTDVSLATTRVLLLVRGRRLLVSFIGFFEILVYILALRQVVGTLTHPASLVVYALGFATGNYVGSIIEEKLAFGYVTVQVIPHADGDHGLVAALRNSGFGVTVLTGEGKESLHAVLLVSARRKELPELLKKIDSNAPHAFVTVLDARMVQGGIFRFRKGK